jgi:coenzyme F420-reducing hydrogenase beta subunit
MEIQGVEYRPVLRGLCREGCGVCLRVCPFLASGENSTPPAGELFADEAGLKQDAVLGRYLGTHVGAVSDAADRARSASGGAAGLVLRALLEDRKVDAVAAVVPTGNGRPWHAYRILTSVEEVAASGGSVYQPVHLADLLKSILAGPKRLYAITALPCFAKALRKAQQCVPELGRRVAFILGLACGGCPSLAYAPMESLLAGVSHPKQVCYRRKSNSGSSRNLDFVATDPGGREQRLSLQGVGGFLWANRICLCKGCWFCDDVFAELADATFMDAWLEEYEADPRGTSLLIIRRRELLALLERQQAMGAWQGRTIEPERVVASQAKQCRNKRTLLRYRVEFLRKRGEWVPPVREALLRDDGHVPAKTVRRAMALFQAQEALRGQLAGWSEHYAGEVLSAWRAKLAGLRLCWRVAACLREHGVKPSHGNAVIHLGGVLTSVLGGGGR